MTLEVEITEYEDFAVLSTVGAIDVGSVPVFRDHLHALVAGGADNIIVDLEAATFLDSTALGAMVGALKRLRAIDGELRVVCNTPPVCRIFSLTGLAKVFPMFNSVDDAAHASK